MSVIRSEREFAIIRKYEGEEAERKARAEALGQKPTVPGLPPVDSFEGMLELARAINSGKALERARDAVAAAEAAKLESDAYVASHRKSIADEEARVSKARAAMEAEHRQAGIDHAARETALNKRQAEIDKMHAEAVALKADLQARLDLVRKATL